MLSIINSISFIIIITVLGYTYYHSCRDSADNLLGLLGDTKEKEIPRCDI
ncbi:MAG: hypothetical protein SVR08_17780 [Spirochaetota bacterium]|nr:hypothetical protein [Spirochaetota bacterium]